MHKPSDGSPSTWKRESGYIWSMIGSAVGFANIIAFSARTYLYGGGAFLIPFVVALFFLGIPMLFLEGAIGHAYQAPLVTAYGRVVGRIGKFFGWLAVLACCTIGSFYTVLTGYAVAYIYFTAADKIPADASIFFEQQFIKMSQSITHWGGFSFWALFFTIIVIAFTWYVMVRNVQAGIERVCTLFLPMLFALIFVFVFVVYFLPGSHVGFYHYLFPDFSKLQDPALWRDTFGHLFFSISAGLGIIVGYSRHTKRSTDIRRAMFYVILGDFAISFMSGLAIFGCIGYLSVARQIPFHHIITSSSIFEIGFKTFPTILALFGGFFYRIVGPLFFFSLFIAGVTGVFSIVESIAGNIEVEFGLSRYRAVSLTLSCIAALSILFCFGNGMHVLGALEPMVMGNNMLIGGIALITIFMYCGDRIRQDVVWFVKRRRSIFYYAIKFLAPVVLPIILWWNINTMFADGFTVGDMVAWGWLALASIIACILSAIQHKRF